MKKIHKFIVIMCIMVNCIIMTSCKVEDPQEERIGDLKYSVVKESEIPTELLEQIPQKKEKEFKCTFYNKEHKNDLYLIVGYGAQPTGGYSIKIEDLYLTENSIYFDTSLIGPSKDDVVSQVVTYPYIVVRIDYVDKPVTFV